MNTKQLRNCKSLPLVKLDSSNIYVGDVTINEICDALQKSDSLEPFSFYPHIIALHRSKIPDGSAQDILNNLTLTLGQLDLKIKINKISCRWLYYLYDSIIALALYNIVSTKNSRDVTLSELLDIIVSSWEKSKNALPNV